MTSRTETFVVEHSKPTQRFDAFLREIFPVVSRGTFQRLIEEGHITVEGKVVKATHHPRAGETVVVHWPEARAAENKPEDIPLEILFEDKDLLVLNKPPGIVVHPSAGHDEHTLVNALLHHCRGQLSGIGGVARPGIVHRLDKDTSGCLVVAKTDEAHLFLAEQFAGRSMEKIYHAIVCGEVTKMEGDIRASIARHPSHRKRMAATDGKGRDAWTGYKVLERMNQTTLVEANLHTGRTHQIRVHFQHLGYPVLGDDVYGERQNKRLKELTQYSPPRQMLHAFKITFLHPGKKKPITMEAPWPLDFSKARDLLSLK